MGFIMSAFCWLLVKAHHLIIVPLRNKRLSYKPKSWGWLLPKRACEQQLLQESSASVRHTPYGGSLQRHWWKLPPLWWADRLGSDVCGGAPCEQTSKPSCDSNQLFCERALACKAIPLHDGPTGENNQENGSTSSSCSMVASEIPPPLNLKADLIVSCLPPWVPEIGRCQHSQEWGAPSMQTLLSCSPSSLSGSFVLSWRHLIVLKPEAGEDKDLQLDTKRHQCGTQTQIILTVRPQV